jgi:hypothetical protein
MSVAGQVPTLGRRQSSRSLDLCNERPTVFKSSSSIRRCAVTAVHNHLLRSEPLPFYMHVGGHGDPAKMAETIRNALAVSKTPLTPPAAPAAPPAIDLDTAQLDQIIGAKGAANGGVYQFNVPRRDPITEGGMMVGMPAMGGAPNRERQWM